MEGFGDLLAGYRRFRTNSGSSEAARWRELAEGQSPRACIIACSDSRVDPAIIFDTDPGEIFVVRNVANLIPPFEVGGGRHGVSAALEFAVTQLEVPEVMVVDMIPEVLSGEDEINSEPKQSRLLRSVSIRKPCSARRKCATVSKNELER